ncbi:MAG: formate--tetrahydrofolate ligase [Planctomycetes bacterium]|nr:formate--tetrahydrofolate ligase [Planctomycetota bacterium]MCW8136208.1 formate--tetrahydrofolate ligase [Planctomycetota bacterium]
MKPDQEIAKAAKLEPIEQVAKRYGIERSDLELYGDIKAKVKLSILDRLKDRPNGKFIDITAISPTPLGEGKTTNTVGVTMGLTHIGKKAACCIRQASLGPVFGIKGGAAGGGYAQVIPPEDLNIHLTGDIHAVQAANNLACAFLDNHLFSGNELGIDPGTINIRRGMDINDRDLRDIITGLDGNGKPRETGFDIAVASEVMAILALAEDIHDMRKRLGRIVVGFNKDGKAVTCEDLKVAGAMTAIMRDAIKPNILQTIGGSLAFVHAGPFANIAHGNSSIVADRVALKVADYVVTESGFGADMGAEKFFNIKCRQGGLVPDAVGLVATVRALKNQSGNFKVKPGKPLPEGLVKEDLKSLEAGMPNLTRHVRNCVGFGLPVVVAINVFGTETEKELEMVRKAAMAAGAHDCVISEVFAKGGEGGAAFARALVKACDEPKNFQFTYDLNQPIKKKVEAIATKIYGAGRVDFSAEASKRIKSFEEAGFGKLPVCMAKTQYSFSHDPSLLGAPEGYTLPIKDARLSAGAGFVYMLCGDMMTMPGLGKKPGGENIDIDAQGNIIGMF